MDMKRQKGSLQTAWMNKLLIAVNVLVFAAGMAGGKADSMYRAGALFAPLLLKGQGWYRLVTSVFLHADVTHLFNNMIVQFAGGDTVEKNLGHIRYGIVYVLCGIGGNLVSVAMDFITGEYGFSIGASGAVFGIVGALLYMILREAADRHRTPTARMKNLAVRAVLMAAYLLYSGWKNPVVNQAAHVGGMVLGFVLTAALMPHGGSDLTDLLQ